MKTFVGVIARAKKGSQRVRVAKYMDTSSNECVFNVEQYKGKLGWVLLGNLYTFYEDHAKRMMNKYASI